MRKINDKKFLNWMEFYLNYNKIDGEDQQVRKEEIIRVSHFFSLQIGLLEEEVSALESRAELGFAQEKGALDVFCRRLSRTMVSLVRLEKFLQTNRELLALSAPHLLALGADSDAMVSEGAEHALDSFDNEVFLALAGRLEGAYRAALPGTTALEARNLMNAQRRRERGYLVGLGAGLLLGGSVVFLLIAAVCIARGAAQGRHVLEWDGLRVFRCLGVPLFGFLMWTLDARIWHLSRVRHKLLMGFSPETTLSWSQSLLATGVLGICFSFTLCVYTLQRSEFLVLPNVPSGIWPAALLLGAGGLALLPSPLLWGSTRLFLAKSLVLTVATAPVFPATLWQGIYANILSSMAVTWGDAVFSACWISSGDFLRTDQTENGEEHDGVSGGEFDSPVCRTIEIVVPPILVCLPILLLTVQAVVKMVHHRSPRHIGSVAKYCLALTLVLSSSLYALTSHQNIKHHLGTVNLVYMVFFFFYTFFACFWDIYFDFGLLRELRPGRHFLLRRHLFYPHPGIYYLAILENISLRFFFALNLAGQHNPLYVYISPLPIRTISALLDLFRRYIWVIFKLESSYIQSEDCIFEKREIVFDD